MIGDCMNKIQSKIKTLAYYVGKAKDRFKDCVVLFGSAHLLRELINGSGLDLIRKEECDKNLISIAFYPTGGFGDYIISSKLLDEILLSIPCRIDVYCENVVFGTAIYQTRPGVRVIPYESLQGHSAVYDLVLRVEHFVHVLSCNQYRIAKIQPDFSDKIVKLGKAITTIRPEIEQQWYRELTHFRICSFHGIDRYTELRMGNVFKIPDRYAYVDLKEEYSDCLENFGLKRKGYITLNRGADSMGRSTMQTKVWPQEHYEKLVQLIKHTNPDMVIVQLGTASNTKIEGVDKYVLGRSMEVTKWLLKNSLLHIDCEGGLVHLATQLGTKCVVLFGPTPMNMYAYPQNINLVSSKCSNCMGTHKDWAFSCLKDVGKALCMYDLRPDYVYDNIKEFLKCRKLEGNKEIRTVFCENKIVEGDYDSIEKQCQKENPYAVVGRKTFLIIEEIEKNARKQDDECKVAVVGFGTDLLGHMLYKLGYSVIQFDDSYGYSGKMGDTTFQKYTMSEQRVGIECRIGDIGCIPYEEHAFDVLISRKMDSESIASDCERVLKQKGIHIVV